MPGGSGSPDGSPQGSPQGSSTTAQPSFDPESEGGVASAKDIFERARNERGEGGEDGSGDGSAGEEGDWEQSNEIPGDGDGSDQQTAAAGDGEAGTASGSGDAELDRALEGFDGAILAERQIILARSNETAGTRPGPPGAMGGNAAQASQSEQNASAGGGMPDSIPGTRSIPVPMPRGEATAGVEVPEDLPDASDDDVVARQLREMAMNEPDPVLREKLWAEYRNYKSGS